MAVVSLFRKIILLRVPVLAAILTLIFLYTWSSSTAVIPGKSCDSCFNTQPNNHSKEESWKNPAYKEIEKLVKLQRSWTSSPSSSNCQGRGIYVYELPARFNKELLGECGKMTGFGWADFCKYLSNGGLGEAVEKLGRGWHNTHQFALDPIFHSRFANHKCRVRQQRQASLFYVPYYGGLDVLRWRSKNVSTRVKDSLALDLLRWLRTQEPWRRNAGRDHVFVLGTITWDFRKLDPHSWGTNMFLLQEEMQNPMKLLIERQPWHVNDVGVPYPTFFHPQTDADIVNWQLKVSESRRSSVVAFAAANRATPESIRSILIEQCTNIGECKFYNCEGGGCDRAEAIVELFMESEFCLQPPGDTATRKSVFDSLVSGCIPVVFDPFTAYYQYPWHLPEDGRLYSVMMGIEEVRNKSVNVVDRLVKIPVRVREDMRRYIIHHLLPRLIYGDAQSQFHDFQDAFSVTVNSLIGRLTTLNGK
ncbi:xyloglucan-specific galacturonosyltransferase 1-like [Salvia miltiorrhiza]|uniref:xyloglucan-specific galacturonosyltransferase 1-like n=1 Tax=Salvia miltiorrhiza TaxID=226208 RepID=UPI0025AD6F2C|nr:xyloglucan-specific galacturonosyltransferase 1-like [Salvia miltiorrhiza]